MPRIRLPNDWVPRRYQLPAWSYLEGGGRKLVAVWHRRAGKDEVALHWAAVAAHQRVGTYWHMLPEYAQARKAIWNAINPHTGRRRIDDAFPHELRATTNEHEMFIRFKSGSTWQVVGSDNFNSLVGSPPVGVVYSEWSLANPLAQAYLSPILAENGGWQIYIYTARGYNHGFSTYEEARSDAGAFAQLLTVDDTGVIAGDALARIKREYQANYGPEHGDALFRQEFYNDWSAANIGSILGSAVERAEKEGRITDDIEDSEWPVILSCDLGFRDTTSWWYWRPMIGGFELVDYDQGVGMDADDWIARLMDRPYPIERIWLPHDARAKTFATKDPAVDRFVRAFGAAKVGIVPQSKVADRINAGRRVIERCRFARTKCRDGLTGLRSWSFDFDEEKRIYSKEPRHDWASHPGDAFTYGAQMLEERLPPPKPAQDTIRGLRVGLPSDETLDDLWRSAPRPTGRI